ncbi:hypothetical protein GOP47_0019907 [Adiantum capillus-veneris]|uniref:PH domain-containing protein n=1 Tax=Adiantum capillus-veneris TaxID=13818 RepID=A0A9D4Z920_ADICA|nr:hypothetical protein GOP47_0019907 [Adiantum capillus-veneris]
MALHDNDLSPHQDGPVASTKASLDRIKQHLTTSSRFLLQGALLKRSETLRKWNSRWFTLDPTTGRMEYRLERGDLTPKGTINFDIGSTIIVSPINLQGLPKYDGCCIYIQNLAKKEYFLCAETRGAARAWVSTLQAAQLVLKAHKEAVSSLGGTGSAKLGTVAAVVAAANATAKEAAKEIAAAMQTSTAAKRPDMLHESDMPMDAMSIMKETLRVKDEELHQVAKEMRARDATIKELAERLSETAEAAEAAASAAQIMDKERKAARTDIAKLRGELGEKIRESSFELEALKGKLLEAERLRDEALREASKWRAELAKARDQAVIMEAALHRAEEAARLASADNKSLSKSSQIEKAGINDAVGLPLEEDLSSESHLNNGVSEDGSSTLHPQPMESKHITEEVNLLGLDIEDGLTLYGVRPFIVLQGNEKGGSLFEASLVEACYFLLELIETRQGV